MANVTDDIHRDVEILQSHLYAARLTFSTVKQQLMRNVARTAQEHSAPPSAVRELEEMFKQMESDLEKAISQIDLILTYLSLGYQPGNNIG